MGHIRSPDWLLSSGVLLGDTVVDFIFTHTAIESVSRHIHSTHKITPRDVLCPPLPIELPEPRPVGRNRFPSRVLALCLGNFDALLYWIYFDGYYQNQAYCGSTRIAKEYAKKGYEAGDSICAMLYATFRCEPKDKKLAMRCLPEVQELAKQGDMYAEYVLGIVDINEICGERDYISAVQHFIASNRDRFYRAVGSFFLRYYNGNEPFKKDWINGQLWAKEVLKYMHTDKVWNVAYMYMKIKDYGCEDENMQNSFYQQAIDLWEYLTDLGNIAAPTNLGWMHENGRGTPEDMEKAFHYYTIAAGRGDCVGQCNLANSFKYEKGTAKNLDLAIKWYHEAANQGNQDAINASERLGVEL